MMSKVKKKFVVPVAAFAQADLSAVFAALSKSFLSEVWQGSDDAWLKSEREVLANFLGVKDWVKTSAKAKEQAGQKWAEVAQEYLLGNKAVSAKLEQVLTVFVEWAKLRYVQVRSETTAEIGVEAAELFNRLLTVEEYVGKNELVEGYYSSLPPAVSKKFTAKELVGLADLQAKASWQAQKALLATMVAVFQPKVQKEQTTSYDSVYQAALVELAEQPLYKAIAAIEQDLSVDAWQLAQGYLLKEAGEQKFTQQVLQSFAYIAELYEFSAGAELATRILQVLPVSVQAQLQVAQYFQTKYDSVYSEPEILAQKSVEVMYNSYGAKFAASELRLLAKANKQVVNVDGLLKELAAQAKADIEAMVLAEAMATAKYVTAERRAWEKAVIAWSEGKLPEALRQKEIQLYNYCLVQESLVARERYEEVQDYLLAVSLETSATWSARENFAQVAALLERFGYLVVGWEKDAVEESLFEYVRRQEQSNPDMIKVASWLESDIAVYQVTEKLTLAEFTDVANAVRNIKKVDALGLASDGLAVVAGGTKSALLARLQATTGKVDSSLVQAVLLGTTDVEVMLTGLGEVWQQTFAASVQKAARYKSKLLAKVCSKLDKAYSLAGLDRKKRYKDRFDKVFVSEWNVALSKEELRVIALNLGSAENVSCLLKELPKRFGAGAWSEESVKYVLANYLTQEDFSLVARIWQAVDLAPEFATMSDLLVGYHKEEKELPPVDFVLADGSYVSMPGGYYFLRSDVFLAMDEERELEGYLGALPYNNVLVDRVNVDSWSIEWDFAQVFRHVERLAHDIAFRPVLHDLNKLMQEQEVLLSSVGAEGLKLLSKWLKSVARDDKAAEFAAWSAVANELLASKYVTNSVLFEQIACLPKNIDAEVYKQALADYIPAVLNGTEWQSVLTSLLAGKSKMLKVKMAKLSSELEGGFFVGKSQSREYLQWARLLVGVPVWLATYAAAQQEGKAEKTAISLADRAIRQYVDCRDKQGLQAMEVCLSMFGEFFQQQVVSWQEENALRLSSEELAAVASVMARQYVGMGIVQAVNRAVELPMTFVDSLSLWCMELLPSSSYATGLGLQNAFALVDRSIVLESVQKSALSVKDEEQFRLWLFSAYNSKNEEVTRWS